MKQKAERRRTSHDEEAHGRKGAVPRCGARRAHVAHQLVVLAMSGEALGENANRAGPEQLVISSLSSFGIEHTRRGCRSLSRSPGLRGS